MKKLSKALIALLLMLSLTLLVSCGDDDDDEDDGNDPEIIEPGDMEGVDGPIVPYN